jgi:hypothetical protein
LSYDWLIYCKTLQVNSELDLLIVLQEIKKSKLLLGKAGLIKDDDEEEEVSCYVLLKVSRRV